MTGITDRTLARVERVFDTLAIAAMFVAMIVVSLDVFCRYILNAPQPWVRDLLVLYLLPALFFMGLPGSYRRGAHVSVDILANHVSPPWRLALSLVARGIAIAVFTLIAWYGGFRFLEAWAKGEIQPGILFNYPIWPSTLLVPAGCGLAALRALERLVAEVAAMLGGSQAIESAVRDHAPGEEVV
ncbi:MAG: TRAP transporter small permease [Pseudooceanicola sp.]|nr:TRAP transporter small permease [Pseudooceanicola sp.]